MNIRQVNVSVSDKLSAMVFFQALDGIYDLGNCRILDAFARNGQLTLASYAKVANASDIVAWELSEEHEGALRKFTSNVSIGCSYEKAILNEKSARKFDMIVIDTPQGLHKTGYGDVAVEHFNFLPLALNMLKPIGVLVLYVNKEPYDKNKSGSHGYDEYAEYDFKKWMQVRQDFYGVQDGRYVDESQAVEGYRKFLLSWGWRLGGTVMVPCFSDVPGKNSYAFRLALQVERVQ